MKQRFPRTGVSHSTVKVDNLQHKSTDNNITSSDEVSCNSGNSSVSNVTHHFINDIDKLSNSSSSVSVNIHTTRQEIVINRTTISAALRLALSIFTDLCPQGMLPLAYLYATSVASGSSLSLRVVSWLLVAFSVISAGTMVSFATLAQTTGSASLSEIATKLLDGQQWGLLVELVVAIVCFSNCLFYLSSLTRITTNLVDGIWGNGFDLLDKSRSIVTTISIVLLSGLVLKERKLRHRKDTISVKKTEGHCHASCLFAELRKSATALVSVISAVSLLYFLQYRETDGAYSIGSRLLDHLPRRFRPRFDTTNDLMQTNHVAIISLLQSLSIVFVSHYSTIPYFNDFSSKIEHASGSGKASLKVSKLNAFAGVVVATFLIVSIVFSQAMGLGFRLFGFSSQPVLLNNFPASADDLAVLVRLITALSLSVYAYPSMFTTLQESVESLLRRLSQLLTSSFKVDKSQEQPLSLLPRVERVLRGVVSVNQSNKLLLVISLHLLITLLVGGLADKQLTLLTDFCGMVFSSSLVYTIPSSLQLLHTYRRLRVGLSVNRLELIFNIGIMLIGLLSTLGGLHSLRYSTLR